MLIGGVLFAVLCVIFPGHSAVRRREKPEPRRHVSVQLDLVSRSHRAYADYDKKEIVLLSGEEFYEKTENYRELEQKIYGNVSQALPLICSPEELKCSSVFEKANKGSATGFFRVKSLKAGTFFMTAEGLKDTLRHEQKWTVFAMEQVTVQRLSFFEIALPFLEGSNIEAQEHMNNIGLFERNSKYFLHGFASKKSASKSIVTVRAGGQSIKIALLIEEPKTPEDSLPTIQLFMKEIKWDLKDLTLFADCLAKEIRADYTKFSAVSITQPTLTKTGWEFSARLPEGSCVECAKDWVKKAPFEMCESKIPVVKVVISVNGQTISPDVDEAPSGGSQVPEEQNTIDYNGVSGKGSSSTTTTEAPTSTYRFSKRPPHQTEAPEAESSTPPGVPTENLEEIQVSRALFAFFRQNTMKFLAVCLLSILLLQITCMIKPKSKKGY